MLAMTSLSKWLVLYNTPQDRYKNFHEIVVEITLGTIVNNKTSNFCTQMKALDNFNWLS